MKKSLLILSALMALSMAFVGCEGGSDPVQDPAVDVEKEVDLSKAKVGYGLTVNYADDVLTIVNDESADKNSYSQAAIPVEVGNAKKAVITYKATGNITLGFMKSGSDPWGLRIDGKDSYQNAVEDFTDVELDIPAETGFITVGSNNVLKNTIVISKIVLK